MFSEQEDYFRSFIFEDVSSVRKAPAWEYFHLNRAEKLAKCQFPECAKTFSIKNGMTTLLKHLKGRHNIDLKTSRISTKFTSEVEMDPYSILT